MYNPFSTLCFRFECLISYAKWIIPRWFFVRPSSMTLYKFIMFRKMKTNFANKVILPLYQIELPLFLIISSRAYTSSQWGVGWWLAVESKRKLSIEQDRYRRALNLPLCTRRTKRTRDGGARSKHPGRFNAKTSKYVSWKQDSTQSRMLINYSIGLFKYSGSFFLYSIGKVMLISAKGLYTEFKRDGGFIFRWDRKNLTWKTGSRWWKKCK